MNPEGKYCNLENLDVDVSAVRQVYMVRLKIKVKESRMATMYK